MNRSTPLPIKLGTTIRPREAFDAGNDYCGDPGGGGGGQAPVEGGGETESSASQIVITYSVWDGDWALLEEYGPNNTLMESYVQGYHGLVKTLVANVYYYQDSLGSTSHVADASGHLLEWYKYNLYGAPRYFSASNSELPSSNYQVKDLHGGARWMPELGLYDDRNRFMSPDLGRFLQPDPIGFKGDASNLYRFCGNDWGNRTDPMGLDAYTAGNEIRREKAEAQKLDRRVDFAHMSLERYHAAFERGAINVAQINKDIAQNRAQGSFTVNASPISAKFGSVGASGSVFTTTYECKGCHYDSYHVDQSINRRELQQTGQMQWTGFHKDAPADGFKPMQITQLRNGVRITDKQGKWDAVGGTTGTGIQRPGQNPALQFNHYQVLIKTSIRGMDGGGSHNLGSHTISATYDMNRAPAYQGVNGTFPAEP